MAEVSNAPAPTTNASAGNPPQTGPKTGQTQVAPTPAEVRMLKLKLDGKDVELPENEVIARAQKSTTSDQRFQEASQMRKQAEELMEFAKANPREFFKKTGMNARQWAEEYLMDELRAEQMSPEQRKAAENEAKLKEYEKEKKLAQDQAKQKVMAEMQAKHAENYNKLFVEALTKSGLPKTNYTVKRMAELQLVNIRQKLDLNADQLAKIVREDFETEQKSLFSAFDGDQLMNFLGPDLVKKLSKAQIAQLKAKSLKPATSGDQNRPRKQPLAQKGVSDWRAWQLRNRGRS